MKRLSHFSIIAAACTGAASMATAQDSAVGVEELGRPQRLVQVECQCSKALTACG